MAVGSDSEDRRAAKRTDYSASAVLYLGQERLTSRAVNVSAEGMLVIPPVRVSAGSRLRINLTLPALDQILDLNGVVVRETFVEGYAASGIQFEEPSEETRAALQEFVKWTADGRAKGLSKAVRWAQVEEAGQATELRHRYEAALDRVRTGPFFIPEKKDK